ncbi:unnamed protein product [Lactuca saligna]|uniref:C2 domain-containing protein n=1 Tax=Lactuca saligna TaxID=75948 RepID=A0AA35YZ11_LACSI|nr:unnamed protein product [Lactuca saligna]
MRLKNSSMAEDAKEGTQRFFVPLPLSAAKKIKGKIPLNRGKATATDGSEEVLSACCGVYKRSSSLVIQSQFFMEHLLGLLRIHVNKGVNLAIRDVCSSDPYVVIRMGKQKLKTRVVKNNINPVWDEALTLSVSEPLPVKLEVYDRDTFSLDDKMGDAVFDIQPFLEAIKMRLNNLPNGTIITTVKPTRTNCLSEESQIIWTDGKAVQKMVLRLQNVECGEIEIQLSWIDIPGSRGLK